MKWVKKPVRRKISEAIAGYVFLAPVLILMSIFLIYPMIYSFILSFQHFSFFNPDAAEWIFLQNYIDLFHDRDFLNASKNTIVLALGIVPIAAFLALFMAVLINQKIKGRTFFRVSYYLPNVTSTVAIATIIGFLFRRNSFLTIFLSNILGIANTSWFADVNLALPLVMITMIWGFSGFYMLVYLSGLQEIPETLYEAAKIDGAGKLKQFIYITLPMLKPTHFLVILMLTINSFQAFDQPYVLSTFSNSAIAGGPAGAVSTVVIFLYQNAFKYFRMSYASAAAFLLFIIIFVFALILKRFFED